MFRWGCSQKWQIDSVALTDGQVLEECLASPHWLYLESTATFLSWSVAVITSDWKTNNWYNLKNYIKITDVVRYFGSYKFQFNSTSLDDISIFFFNKKYVKRLLSARKTIQNLLWGKYCLTVLFYSKISD